MDKIKTQTQSGFMATTAVVLLSVGTMAFVAVALGSASIYADGIDREEVRLQKELNNQACNETLPIIISKDYFFEGEEYLDDFGCTVSR